MDKNVCEEGIYLFEWMVFVSGRGIGGIGLVYSDGLVGG